MVDTWTQIPPLGTPHEPTPDPEFTREPVDPVAPAEAPAEAPAPEPEDKPVF